MRHKLTHRLEKNIRQLTEFTVFGGKSSNMFVHFVFDEKEEKIIYKKFTFIAHLKIVNPISREEKNGQP